METKTLCFYKGTAYPAYYDIEQISKDANRMIQLGLISNVSIKTQITDYKNQLDTIESLMNLYSENNIITENTRKKVSDTVKLSDDRIYVLWGLNIAALLKLKAIPNDDNFGIITITEKNMK